MTDETNEDKLRTQAYVESLPSQETINKWYKHKSNKEIWIEEQEEEEGVDDWKEKNGFSYGD